MKQHLKSGPGLVFGIPTLGRPVSLDWALSLKSLNPPINFSTLFQIVHNKEIGAARNDMASFAIEKDAKYLFFMGDDVEIPAHALRQLIYRMEQDDSIGVIGGVYCAKATPTFPLVFRGFGNGAYWDWKIGECFEVTGLGMDCTLIRVDLLRELKSNWFKTIDNDNYLDGINSAESWTEDLFFCKKVLEETKYKIFVDAGIICNHWDIYGGKKYNLPQGSLPMRQKLVENPKRCLFIGEPLPFDDPEYDLTSFGGSENVDYRGINNQLPFETGEFDWIIINDTDNDFKTSLREWIRVLRPLGKVSLLISDPFISIDAVKFFLKEVTKDIHMNGAFLEFYVSN